MCRDKLVNQDSPFIPATRFSIIINVEDIITEMKKEGIYNVDKLDIIENRLFYFFQNQKLENKLTKITNDRYLNIMNEEFDNFITFKLALGEKAFRDEKGSINLGYLLSLIPQYLSGDEFKSETKEEIHKSPRGQINAIVTYNYDSKSYTTYIEVDCVWVMFHDRHVKQLHFLENVFENMLLKRNIPIILIYAKCPCLIQRNNQQISDMIKDYLQLCTSK